MRIFGLKLEDNYGEYQANTDMVIHQRFEKASFSLNGSPVTLRLGSKDVRAARLGYLEPSGSTETTMDTKTFQYIMMSLLGNYSHTIKNDKHYHEFHSGENARLPSFSGDFVYDFARNRMMGLQADEVKIEVKSDLVTVATEWIYKTERSTLLRDGNNDLIIDLEEQGLVSTANYTVVDPKGIPFIGYDATMQIGTENAYGTNNIPSFVVNEASISVKNNHKRDSAKSIFQRAPKGKPVSGDRDIEVTFNATLDKKVYALMIAAEYGQAPDLENGTVFQPHACRFTTLPVKLKFQTCEDSTEYVKFVWNKCLLTADKIEVSGNDEITVSFTLIPMGTDDTPIDTSNSRTIDTAMYVCVVNDQPEIGEEDQVASGLNMSPSPTMISNPRLNLNEVNLNENNIEETSDETDDIDEVNGEEEDETQ